MWGWRRVGFVLGLRLWLFGSRGLWILCSRIFRLAVGR